MERRTFLKTSGLAALGLISNSWSLPIQKPRKPNILLIMTDQQSSDAMSCVIGNKYLNTPTMDSIAKNGIRFTNAYCANPLCMPARTSIFTGIYPHETTIQTNDNGKVINQDQFPNMGKLFKDFGYDTGYVGKWHIAFDEKDINSHGFDYMRNIKDNGADNASPTAAVEFINQKREKPFLLVASFINPHNICEWARGQKLPDGEVGNPPSIDECPPLRKNSSPSEDEADIVAFMRKSYQSHKLFPVSNFDDKKWREYIWAYYRMIEKVDAQIGIVLKALRESGQEKDTVILFTSDHGDSQGAHKWSQKTVFYDESSRIPFIISYKRKTKIGTSDTLVNNGIDIIPTLCEYAGIKIPQYLPGKSLKRVADGVMKNDAREYIVVSNKMVQGAPVDGETMEPDGRMVRSKQYKYCAYSLGKNRESLFNLKNDPGEMINLAGKDEYKKILTQHRNYLSEWCAKYKDSFEVPK